MSNRYLLLFIDGLVPFPPFLILWGPIDPIGTIRMGRDWAYSPIPSLRIRVYPRTISKGRNENCIIGRGKEYLWRT